ncbi:TetR/AcrR family transcriptional regulator C-terminal domain-containing protein [Methylomonas sp. EFPC3]|uniref:TetR/AcrR family transcriptional regulator C-terminal domain-containing protein n=1 Tax=Methylomonas sp. EFPC3 TaxID=3021710 RepID=UPI00241678C0|nr:TetR/AcrR family transcriptional regulator C-terminal domain-containing protein [Methylomonas sp. EFPC3]WFP51574.1 TetR/AcrR family transcriptional regulator C-terminal domain-containing protein [Methylomonas sp. EFPC3]
MAAETTNKPKVGRPKAGTEAERNDHLLDQALVQFMREGYAAASIAKIAAAAGVSTRTIYERYKNKAELMLASVDRLVETDISEMQGIENLQDLACRDGLIALGEKLLGKVMQPDMISFYRMGVAEACRFPELSELIKNTGPKRIQEMIAAYLHRHAAETALSVAEFESAAALFLEMLIAEPRNKALFGILETDWDARAHVEFVVQVFLYGIAGRRPS